MSNVSEYIGLLDDLRDQGSINEQWLNALVMRAAFDELTPEQVENILAQAETYQIDEWKAQADLKAENKRRRAAAAQQKLDRDVVPTPEKSSAIYYARQMIKHFHGVTA